MFPSLNSGSRSTVDVYVVPIQSLMPLLEFLLKKI